MEKFEQFKKQVIGLETDINKFYNKANKAAAVRVRKGILELKALGQEIRADILEHKHKLEAQKKKQKKK